MTLKDACSAVTRAVIKAVTDSKPARYIQKALSSYFFPPVVAAVSVLCYYLGWEMVNVWFICFAGTAILVFCKDASPLYCLLIFLSVFMSVQHCPNHMGAGSGYLFETPNLVQLVIAIIIFASALLYRIVDGVIRGRVKFNSLFWTLVGLCVALCLNGLFYAEYVSLNLVYGLALSATFIAVYLFTNGNVILGGDTFKKIASYLVALSLVISLEVIVAYCTYEGLIVDGVVQRSVLFVGWGTYNMIGGLLVITLPAWFYLAGKFKYGYPFLVGALFNFVMCFLSMSRQAMLMSMVLMVPCCVWLLIVDKGIKRVADVCILAGVLGALAIWLGTMHTELKKFFEVVFISLKTGSDRTELWKVAMTNFMRKPLFGIGFYDPLAEPESVGYWGGGFEYIIPEMAHNTIIQLFGCCGAVGIIAYAVHRTRTVLSYLNRVTGERTFVFLTMMAVLLVSLLDNHIFYFLPTVTYTVMISLLNLTEKQAERVAVGQ